MGRQIAYLQTNFIHRHFKKIAETTRWETVWQFLLNYIETKFSEKRLNLQLVQDVSHLSKYVSRNELLFCFYISLIKKINCTTKNARFSKMPPTFLPLMPEFHRRPLITTIYQTNICCIFRNSVDIVQIRLIFRETLSNSSSIHHVRWWMKK